MIVDGNEQGPEVVALRMFCQSSPRPLERTFDLASVVYLVVWGWLSGFRVERSRDEHPFPAAWIQRGKARVVLFLIVEPFSHFRQSLDAPLSTFECGME